MQILDGGEQLSSQQEPERQLLRREKKPESDRISCVTRVNGDCTVTTTYW
jgi:ferredoxin